MSNQIRVHEVDLDCKTYYGVLEMEITVVSPREIEDGRDLYHELHGDAPDRRFQNYDIAVDYYYEGRQVVREQVRIVRLLQGHRSLSAGYVVESVVDQTRTFVDKCKMDSVLESEMSDPRRPRMNRSQVRSFPIGCELIRSLRSFYTHEVVYIGQTDLDLKN